MNNDKAVRYNNNKLRYDLIPSYTLEKIAEAFTEGCKKYPERNWEKGFEWMSVVASLKRHLEQFCKGVDLDSESNLPHILHVIMNSIFLLEYYNIYPEGDNRPHAYLSNKKYYIIRDPLLESMYKDVSFEHLSPRHYINTNSSLDSISLLEQEYKLPQNNRYIKRVLTIDVELFIELTRQGYTCYLLDHETNATFNPGYKKIKDLKKFL